MNRESQGDLQARIDELEKADRAKDQFLALLSHELRNHIHAIRTNAWLIKARTKDVELARPTDAIDRQVVKLSKLVEDLLDVIRVAQKSHLAFEDVSLQQVVSAAVAATQSAVHAHRRELLVAVPDEAVCVHADPVRLQQAVANVLQNAVKYSAQQSTVRVRVMEEAGQATVSIKDQGIGIEPHQMPRIFDLYVEGNDRKPNTEGLGIGLHVARELVEAHGGTIQAVSDGLGKGSEFVIKLPVVASAPEVVPIEDTAHRSGGKLSILVVDDNHDAADSLAQVLEAYGHRVQAAYGGEEAVQRAAKGDVQVALVDIGMPTVDGFQVAERISHTPAAKDTLLVAVTGWGEKSDRARSKQAGFAYHLTKPVDFDALASLLATAARKAHH
ncbi:MAG TPA: hybrid sensor histidine kinase/response regulator [Gemmatimonadaceae bacterium]|nr:hybrid sensor histidine kinase/response regulator [Gemmatimonadaceae bacterium]